MIEVYNIVTNKHETTVSPVLEFNTNTITRGDVASRPGKSARYNSCMFYNQHASSASLQFLHVDWPARPASLQLSPTHAILYANIADVRQK